MKPDRRFSARRPKPYPALSVDHPAALEGRSIHQAMVRTAVPGERVLKSGEHSRKLGSHFSKRPWIDMPIFSMTLEERRTCPRSCAVWNECYGNAMHRAVRWRVGDPLYVKLLLELEQLSISFPRGFAVRLHTLGDFPDRQYLEFWLRALKRHEELHIFGFTAHLRDSDIGSMIEAESFKWNRFRIRFSGAKGDRSTLVADAPSRGRNSDGITCPADMDHPDISCGSCALCMTTTAPIVFGRH